MIKNIATGIMVGGLGLACLGLLALVVARDTLKGIDVGPFDK